MRHLHVVPPPRDDRHELDTLAGRSVLYAARRLRTVGITDRGAAAGVASAALVNLMGGTHAAHAHKGGPGAFRLLCAAIDRLIDCGAEQTRKTPNDVRSKRRSWPA